MLKISVQSTRKYNVWKKLEEKYAKEKLRVMRQIGNSGIQEIKSELDRRQIGNRTGKLRKNIKYKIKHNSIIWESNVSYHKYINEGVHPHIMTYLLKSRKPIPVRLKRGGKIFRWATAKSIGNRAWRHPGFMKGKGYFGTALKRNAINSKQKIRSLSRLFK